MSQQSNNCAIAVIGIDIGKNSFHVVGHDLRGAIVLRQKWCPSPGATGCPSPTRAVSKPQLHAVLSLIRSVPLAFTALDLGSQ